MASLRKAINAKCRECTCDSLDAGTAAQQIACCIDTECPLHPVRPITTTLIPTKLLDCCHITPEQLDAKARALVGLDGLASGSGQNGPLLSAGASIGGVLA